MSLSDKIEEIRKEPEHIRHRYVLVAVAVSMFFILIIWLFSLKESFNLSSDKNEFKNLKEQFNESGPQEELPSLEDLLKKNSE